MNNARRKVLEKIGTSIEEIEETISVVFEEEQESFDNMPEGFQEGERGEKSQECIDEMEENGTRKLRIVYQI